MNHIIHNIDPIIFSVGPLRVGWYGLMYVISFVLGYIMVKRNFSKKDIKLKDEYYESFIFSIILGVMIGARFGYVLFYGFTHYMANPLKIFYVWEGGMSFHGGLLGVIIAVLIFCKKTKQDFFTLADPAMPWVAIGVGFGRIGNFINGELFGKVSNLPWAMIFLRTDPEMLPRHPSQLYEAIFEGFLMAAFLQFMLFKTNIKGLIFWLFIGIYGIVRYLIEFIRIPDNLPIYDNGLIFNMFTMGQVLSLLMVISAIIGISYAVKKHYNKNDIS
ncbi:MAG: prolipoprotein diacylglyceryl transferase [Candidatus Cloacimonetes bacterium]|nr:prolipoprotein diacylglyceryl transferase [Candidatus Cloacimonadota bacterium]